MVEDSLGILPDKNPYGKITNTKVLEIKKYFYFLGENPYSPM
jgi:hypothetical protein